MHKRTFILIFLLIPTLAFAKAPKVYSYKLKNGLQIYIQVNNRAPVVLSQIWYKVGSAYEPKGITGISHVLEHMMFQGTKNADLGYFNKVIAENGGTYNAGTSYDYTVYYEALPAQYLDIALKLEADRMVNINLKKERLDEEMGVVKTEKRLRLDNVPQALLHQKLMSIAFKGQPYQHAIIGYQKDLDDMNLANVKRWYHRWYSPNNAILVVVGDVEPDKVFRLAKKYFGKLKPQKIPALPKAEDTFKGPQSFKLHLPARIPYLEIGFKAPSYNTATDKKDIYALNVLSGILGESSSSILENKLVREQQIAVAVQSSYDPLGLYDSLFLISAMPAHNTSLNTLQHKILAIVKQLQQQPISKKQLQRIKMQITANEIYAQDSLTVQANLIGSLEVINIPWQVGREYVDNINAVTAQQVQAVAKKYLTPSRMIIGQLIPQTKTEQAHAA